MFFLLARRHSNPFLSAKVCTLLAETNTSPIVIGRFLSNSSHGALSTCNATLSLLKIANLWCHRLSACFIVCVSARLQTEVGCVEDGCCSAASEGFG